MVLLMCKYKGVAPLPLPFAGYPGTHKICLNK